MVVGHTLCPSRRPRPLNTTVSASAQGSWCRQRGRSICPGRTHPPFCAFRSCRLLGRKDKLLRNSTRRCVPYAVQAPPDRSTSSPQTMQGKVHLKRRTSNLIPFGSVSSPPRTLAAAVSQTHKRPPSIRYCMSCTSLNCPGRPGRSRAHSCASRTVRLRPRPCRLPTLRWLASWYGMLFLL